MLRHGAEGCTGLLGMLREGTAGLSGTNPGCSSPCPLRALVTNLGRRAGGPVGGSSEHSPQESLDRRRRRIELSWQQSDGLTAADTPPSQHDENPPSSDMS